MASEAPARRTSLAGSLAIVGLVVALLAFMASIWAAARAADANEGGGGGSSGGEIALTEFKIEGALSVPDGTDSVDVVNAGAAVHNLAVKGGPKTADLNAGESEELDLSGLEPGSYEVSCTIPGHAEAGMRGTLTVGAGGGEGETNMGTAGGIVTEEQGKKLDQAMIDSFAPFPAETEGKGNQPLEPEIEADGTKVFKVTGEVADWEVEPGKVVQTYTFNGVVPAPLIKVDVGDKVKVEFTNNLPVATDIHFHGINTPNSEDGVAPLTQKEPAQPGTTYTYQFTAVEPAVGMYHPHLHGQMLIPDGMFGAFIVGDPTIPRGRTVSGIEVPADVQLVGEYPMVLNDAGKIGLTLNGKSFPATEPVVVNEGEWFVVHYFNEGLQAHPMHMHGFPQLVYARDGVPLDYPYWADTINVAPGERFSVLVKAQRPGVWVWHCHILTHAEREDGMFGMVTAVIVNDPNAPPA